MALPIQPRRIERLTMQKKIQKKLKLAQPAADNQFGYFRILPVKPADHRQSKKTAPATCA
jgi:hypothetical protein